MALFHPAQKLLYPCTTAACIALQSWMGRRDGYAAMVTTESAGRRDESRAPLRGGELDERSLTAAVPGDRFLSFPDANRGSLKIAVIVTAALAGSAASLPPGAAPLDAFALNKVLWLCLGIAVLHSWRTRSGSITPGDLAISLPALASAALTVGVWPWIGMALSLSLWLRGEGPEGRRGLLLALAVAVHEVSIAVLGEIAGDALLALDARIAAALAPLVLPTLANYGTALHAQEGHTLILVWGCSSFSNLGQTLLLCWALISLREGTLGLEANARRFLWIGLLGALTVGVNAIRLALMASSVEAYEYIHDGAGGVMFRVALLALAGAVSLVCIHDATHQAARHR